MSIGWYSILFQILHFDIIICCFLLGFVKSNIMGEYMFLLSPKLLHYLESGRNFKFSLFLQGDGILWDKLAWQLLSAQNLFIHSHCRPSSPRQYNRSKQTALFLRKKSYLRGGVATVGLSESLVERINILRAIWSFFARAYYEMSIGWYPILLKFFILTYISCCLRLGFVNVHDLIQCFIIKPPSRTLDETTRLC